MYRIKFKTLIWLLFLFSFIFFTIRYLFLDLATEERKIALKINASLKNTPTFKEKNKVTIVAVVCGQRTEEALVMMKSAILFQGSCTLKFVILAETVLQYKLETSLKQLMKLNKNVFSYEMVNLSFPTNREHEWKSLFKPCAAQRLFLSNILLDYQLVLYVDTDTIFLNELSDIWHHVQLMNSTQMAALVLEHEDPNISWYSRFARHPFYGNLGVNSAVMLMNLTKMREFKWVEYMDPILSKFKLNITYGDQDIINIIFHYHPDKLYLFNCRYNYRPDHCMYKSMCKEAEEKGISVLHGSRGVFHSENQKSFKAIFETFSEYQIGTDVRENLLTPLIKNLQKTKDTYCGALMKIFIRNINKLFGKVNFIIPQYKT